MVRHHHISMFAQDLKVTDPFYTQLLGLRRVKITVNQNKADMYHIFYGDRYGSAGNDFTFFDYSAAGPKVAGTNAHTGVGLLLPSESSLDYWQERLTKHSVHVIREDYLGYDTLSFEDPSGLPLRMYINDSDQLPSEWEIWTANDIEAPHYIQGMGPAEMTVRDHISSANNLVELFGYHIVAQTDHYTRLRPNPAEIYGEIIILEKAGSIEKAGYGTIHHLAIQIEEDNFDQIEATIKAKGFQTTVYDRHFFNSLYFREANSVMIEVVANKALGFVEGDDDSKLGQQLDLPPFLEDRREELTAKLTPIEEWMSSN